MARFDRIKKVLMERDELTAEQADSLINEAMIDLNERISSQEISLLEIDDFCMEWFGLEPDYLEDLIL